MLRDEIHIQHDGCIPLNEEVDCSRTAMIHNAHKETRTRERLAPGFVSLVDPLHSEESGRKKGV